MKIQMMAIRRSPAWRKTVEEGVRNQFPATPVEVATLVGSSRWHVFAWPLRQKKGSVSGMIAQCLDRTGWGSKALFNGRQA